MLINSLVTDVLSRAVVIKKGPRAGTTTTAYSLMVDGKEVDCGFKCPAKKGEMWTAEISDIPNRWGKYEMVKHASSAPTNGATVDNVSLGTRVEQASRTSTGRSGFPIPKSDHATSICRQSALKAAVDFVSGEGSSKESAYSVDDVLEIASQFAKWTTGQLEQEEAERILKSSVHEPNA